VQRFVAHECPLAKKPERKNGVEELEAVAAASGTRKYVYQGTRRLITIKVRDKVTARDVLGTVKLREV
jgi:hypothetical protein